jgi:hypothetical protein
MRRNVGIPFPKDLCGRCPELNPEEMKAYAGKKVRVVIKGGLFTYGGEVLDNGHVCVKTIMSQFDVPPAMIQACRAVK